MLTNLMFFHHHLDNCAIAFQAPSLLPLGAELTGRDQYIVEHALFAGRINAVPS